MCDMVETENHCLDIYVYLNIKYVFFGENSVL